MAGTTVEPRAARGAGHDGLRSASAVALPVRPSAATADFPRSTPARPGAMRLSARWARVDPAWLALTLAAAALAGHGLVFGAAVPLGRAPWLGGPLALLGLGWALWAAAELRRAGTPSAASAPPLVLVEEGPYAFGRHPMYLGTAVLLAGLALALGVPSLAGAATAYLAVVGRVHVRSEEATLNRRFVGWYGDYAAQVRRWL